MFLSCVKSLEENFLSCYVDSEGNVYRFEVKTGEKFEPVVLQTAKTVFQDSLSSKRTVSNLKWTSSETFVVELANDLRTVFDLYIFKRQNNEQELVLLKKLDSILAYDLELRDSNNQYYLVYAKYLSTQRLNVYTFDLKEVKEREDLLISLSYTEKEQKSIQFLNAKFVESKNSQLGMKFVLFFEDYSMSAYNSKGARFFQREEALAYITSVEMIDFPLLHLQEEFEDEFGSVDQDNIVTMFYKRVRTQITQLREFLFEDLYHKLMNALNNNPQRKLGSGVSSSADLSVDEITRDEFNLNKLIVAATSVGKVFGLYTSANGRILWSFYLKNTLPFRLNKSESKNNNLMPLFVQRTAAHVPHEAQCALVSKVRSEDNQIKTKILFFNPLSGAPSKDQPKDGLVLDYDLRQVFLYNFHDSQYLKPLVLLDSKNKLHVLPDRSSNEILTRHISKPSIIYTNVKENEKNNVLVGFSMNSFNTVS